MTLRGEAEPDPAALRRPDQRGRRRGPTSRRRRVQPRRSGEDQRVPAASAVEESRAAHPDPVRLRHDPRLPDDLPDPARRRQRVRPERRLAGPQVRRARVGRGRPQADLQPDGRRLARAALGPHLRGRRRGPVPQLRVRGRAREGRAGPRLLASPTRSSRASSTTPPTASRRAGATTTRPTCRSGGCATSTCRRSRPRSTPAPTPRCARSTRSTASPAARTSELETDMLKKEWGFDGFIESDYTAVAELRMPTDGPIGRAATARADGRRGGRAQRRHRLRDGLDAHPRQRQAAARATAGSRGADRRRRAPDPARQVPRRAVREPLRRPSEGRRRAAAARRRRGRAQGRRPLDGAAQERRRHAAARARARRPRSSARSATTSTTCSARGGAGARTRTRSPSSTASRRRTRTRRSPPGCTLQDTEPPNNTPADECGSDAGFAAAVAAAKAADQVVLALGESREQSGEAASRSEIDLPGKQEELIARIKAAARQAVRGRAVQRPAADARAASSTTRRRSSRRGSPASRPATRSPTSCSARSTPAASCRSRSRAASARCRSTTTTSPPGGRATRRRSTTRATATSTSCDPQYVFGYGLSYSKFEISNLRLSSTQVSRNGSVRAPRST